MSRIVNVVKLQFVNRQTFVGIPLLILGSAFVLSLFVLFLVPYTGLKYAGGAAGAPMWYFGVAGGQALTLTFPFALSLGVTRREFHLGTFLTAAATAMGLAAIYCLIAVIERATNGWGMNGYFSLPFLGADRLGTSFLTYFTATMLLFAIVPGAAPTLNVQAGMVNGTTGCNSYFGPVTLGTSGAFSVGILGSTFMACPEPLMGQEHAFLQALERVRFTIVTGDELRMFGPTETLVFQRAASDMR